MTRDLDRKAFEREQQQLLLRRMPLGQRFWYWLGRWLGVRATYCLRRSGARVWRSSNGRVRLLHECSDRHLRNIEKITRNDPDQQAEHQEVLRIQELRGRS